MYDNISYLNKEKIKENIQNRESRKENRQDLLEQKKKQKRIKSTTFLKFQNEEI